MDRRSYCSPSRVTLSGHLTPLNPPSRRISRVYINPDFDIDTHIEVYDQEIRDIETDTQKTIQSLESMLKNLADVTEELTSAQGSGMSVHRQTIIKTHESQTEYITQAVGEMNFCDEARSELTKESQKLRLNWTGCKSEYWSDPDVTVTAITIEENRASGES